MLKPPNIDKDWFLNILEERNQSVRGLARHMEIDASAVSRMFSGERRMKMEEANLIALFLGVSVKEVLQHAGVAIDNDGQPSRILLVATINEMGNLETLKSPHPLPQAIIDRAHAAISGAGNGKVIAAQVRAADGPLALFDDAVILFKHSDTFDPATIGSLAIVRTAEHGLGLARILKARKTGEATVHGVRGTKGEVDILTSTSVIAIIP